MMVFGYYFWHDEAGLAVGSLGGFVLLPCSCPPTVGSSRHRMTKNRMATRTREDATPYIPCFAVIIVSPSLPGASV